MNRPQTPDDEEQEIEYTYDFKEYMKQFILHQMPMPLNKKKDENTLNRDEFIRLYMCLKNYSKINSKIYSIFQSKAYKQKKFFKQQKVVIKRQVMNDYINIVNKRGEIITKIGEDYDGMKQNKNQNFFNIGQFYDEKSLQNLKTIMKDISPQYRNQLNAFILSANNLKTKVNQASQQHLQDKREKELKQLNEEKEMQKKKKDFLQGKNWWEMLEIDEKNQNQTKNKNTTHEQRIAQMKGYLIDNQDIEKGKKDIDQLQLVQIEKFGSDKYKLSIFEKEMKKMINQNKNNQKKFKGVQFNKALKSSLQDQEYTFQQENDEEVFQKKSILQINKKQNNQNNISNTQNTNANNTSEINEQELFSNIKDELANILIPRNSKNNLKLPENQNAQQQLQASSENIQQIQYQQQQQQQLNVNSFFNKQQKSYAQSAQVSLDSTQQTQWYTNTQNTSIDQNYGKKTEQMLNNNSKQNCDNNDILNFQNQNMKNENIQSEQQMQTQYYVNTRQKSRGSALITSSLSHYITNKSVDINKIKENNANKFEILQKKTSVIFPQIFPNFQQQQNEQNIENEEEQKQQQKFNNKINSENLLKTQFSHKYNNNNNNNNQGKGYHSYDQQQQQQTNYDHTQKKIFNTEQDQSYIQRNVSLPRLQATEEIDEEELVSQKSGSSSNKTNENNMSVNNENDEENNNNNIDAINEDGDDDAVSQISQKERELKEKQNYLKKQTNIFKQKQKNDQYIQKYVYTKLGTNKISQKPKYNAEQLEKYFKEEQKELYNKTKSKVMKYQNVIKSKQENNNEQAAIRIKFGEKVLYQYEDIQKECLDFQKMNQNQIKFIDSDIKKQITKSYSTLKTDFKKKLGPKNIKFWKLSDKQFKQYENRQLKLKELQRNKSMMSLQNQTSILFQPSISKIKENSQITEDQLALENNNNNNYGIQINNIDESMKSNFNLKKNDESFKTKSFSMFQRPNLFKENSLKNKLNVSRTSYNKVNLKDLNDVKKYVDSLKEKLVDNYDDNNKSEAEEENQNNNENENFIAEILGKF